MMDAGDAAGVLSRGCAAAQWAWQFSGIWLIRF